MKNIILLLLISIIFMSCTTSEFVDIPDENLAKVIREALKLKTNSRISINKIDKLKIINAHNRDINDLTGLEKFTSLTTLHLNENNITDLSPLRGLTQLKFLNLYNNDISEIGPLAQLSQLTALLLHDNHIHDISPIRELKQLEYLMLQGNNIQDIGPLSNLRKLRYLSLQENNILNISPLKGMLRLKYLSLQKNQIQDISPLYEIHQLTGLQLANNQISDINPIGILSKLYDLRINNNNIMDVSPISKLENLEVLHISNNPIQDYNVIQKLQYKIPDLVTDIQKDLEPDPEYHSKGLPPQVNYRLGKGGINVMQFSPDGSKLAVGSSVGAWVYDIETGEGIPIQFNQPRNITALTFSTDGKSLTTCGYNSRIQIWDIHTGKQKSIFHRQAEILNRTYLPSQIYAPGSIVSYSKGENILYGIRSDGISGHLSLWDIKSRSPLTLNYIDRDAVYAINSDHSFMIIGHNSGEISKKDIHFDGEIPKITLSYKIRGHSNWINWDKVFNFFRKPKKKIDQPIEAITISQDESLFASVVPDKEVIIWDLISGKEKVTLEDDTNWIYSLVFSNDGKKIITGGGNGNIKVWDVNSGQELNTLIGHRYTITSLVLSPDGKTLVSGSKDGTIRSWDLANKNNKRVVTEGHTAFVESIAFSPDDTTIMSAGSSKKIQNWSVNTGKELTPSLIQNIYVWKGSISKKANLIATQQLNKVRIYDLINNMELPTVVMSEDTSMIYTSHFDFIPNQDILVYAYQYPIVTFINVREGVQLFELSLFDDMKKNTGYIRSMAISPDGQKLAASGRYEGEAKTTIWDIARMNKIVSYPFDADILKFSHDSRLIAVKRWETIEIWDITNSDKVEVNNILHDQVASEMLLFSPDGSKLLSVDYKSHDVNILEIDSGLQIHTLSRGHTAPIKSLLFSHDGNTLATTGEDGTILLWNWKKVLSGDIPVNR